MSSTELDALIIENLVDLDRAAKRINNIECRLYASLTKLVEDWSRRHGWQGRFEYPEGEDWEYLDIWLAPAEWYTSSSGADATPDCEFALDVGPGDSEQGEPGEAWHYLTRLCGLEGGQVGFRLNKPATLKNKTKQWKALVDQFRDQISAAGFIVDSKPSFFLSFCIDPAALVAAVRADDLDPALAPVSVALEALRAAQPIFDRLRA